MFDKDKFIDFINHYYLSGMIKSIVIKSNGNVVSARGRNDPKNLIADITAKDIGLPTGHYAIYDTGALLSMLKVVKSPCEVNVGLNKSDVPISLTFKDETVTAVFVLADESAIPSVSAIKTTLTPDFTFSIDAAFVSQFIKAQGALTDADRFAVISDGTTSKLVINYVESRNTSRITIPVQATVSAPITPLFFNADFLSSILRANLAELNEPNARGTFSLSKMASGIIWIEFGTYIYYLVGEK